MAELTNSDLRSFANYFRRNPAAKAALLSQDLSRPELVAAFQALEDGYEAHRPTLKAAMDSAAGQTISVPLAVHIEAAWQARKPTQGT